MVENKKEKRLTPKREAVRLPVFLPFAGCPFRCIYCQQNSITGKATADSPSQVAKAVERFVRYRRGQKKEVAFFGGTFTALTLSVQEQYLRAVSCQQEAGDTIRLSTRPDCLSQGSLTLLQKYGVQTVELGVQSFSDRVLSASQRGYSRSQAIAAIKLLQDAGLRVTAQLMPFLPGCDQLTLRETLQTTLELRPHEVRIYPTLVLAGTQLQNLYAGGDYTPVELAEAVRVCSWWKQEFESHNIKVIKVGLHSDVGLNSEQIVAGPYHASFGELVKIETLYTKICAENPDQLKELQIDSAQASCYFGHKKLLLKKLKKRFGEFALRVVKSS